MTPLPSTVTGLIEDLEAQYPAKCIGPDQSESEAHRYAGKRELIDHLIERLDAETRKHTDQQVLNR